MIWGAPRSGTSWLGHLMSKHLDVQYRFQPIHAHTFKPRLEFDSSIVDLHYFYARLMLTRDPYVLHGLARDMTKQKDSLLARLFSRVVIFKETHDLSSVARVLSLDSNSRLVVVIRNPIHVVESWINAPREFSPEWNVDEEWRWARKKNAEYSGNHFGVEQWIETSKRVIALNECFPEQVRIIRYERLCARREATMHDVISHFRLPVDRLSLPVSPGTSSGSQLDEYSVSRPRQRSRSWRHLSRGTKLEIETLVRQAGLASFLETPTSSASPVGKM